MSFIVIGVNHNSAPIELRQQLAFPPDSIPTALSDLCHQLGVTEALILSTCNRTEVYTRTADVGALQQWLAEMKAVAPSLVQKHTYHHIGIDAVRHAIRVAAGLDSMALGEPQIVGQLKTALAIAEQEHCVQAKFHHIFQFVLATSKQVRHQTGLGQCPVSVAFSAIKLTGQQLNLAQAKILLIGAGATTALLIKHLQSAGATELLIANRTLANAQALAESSNSQALALAEIPARLPSVDLVITATHSTVPLLTHEMIQSTMTHRHKPLWLVDLANTQNIDPAVANIHGVRLFTVDHIHNQIAHNTQQRHAAAEKAEQLIEKALTDYIDRKQPLEVTQTIIDLRQRLAEQTEQELKRSLAQLNNGDNPEQVLTEFAHRLNQKWAHTPTAELSRLKADEVASQIPLVRKVLGI